MPWLVRSPMPWSWKMPEPVAANAPARSPEGHAGVGTGSTGTRILGGLVLVGLVVVFVLAFFVTEPDLVQKDIVRMLYVHVPIAVVTLYLSVAVMAVASLMVLWKRSMWWDTTAAAAAELGALFCGLMLVTGMIWGRPTWNTWWEWGDVRLMTSLVLFLMLIGYLAYRRMLVDPMARARRSAVLALVSSLNLILVNRSVEWWKNRTLHQESSLIEGKLEDLTLFTLFLAILVFVGLFAWLMIHRFRVGWLEYQSETAGLDIALAERRAQASVDVDEAVQHPKVEPGKQT